MEAKLALLTEAGVLGDGCVKAALGTGVLTVTLSRPQRMNALSNAVVDALVAIVELCKESADSLRVVILKAEGRAFCAGADSSSLKNATREDIDKNAYVFAKFLYDLNHLPQLVVSLVQGAAYGGGLGLIACSDVCFCVKSARFSFSEVRLGMIPATISPYTIAKTGIAAARRYFLTGEAFDAAAAQTLGLVTRVFETQGAMHEYVRREFLPMHAKNAPAAVRAAKHLVHLVGGHPLTKNLVNDTVDELIKIRTRPEVREGAAALMQKRPPTWATQRLDAKL